MTTARRIRIGEQILEYSLIRSKRRKKTVGVRVAPGIVEVAAPSRTTIKEIEEILEKRGKWILEKLEAASEAPPPFQLVSGDRIPLMGRELTLVVNPTDTCRASAKSCGETLVVNLPLGLKDDELRERVRTAVVRWYWGLIDGYLKKRVAHWLPVMRRADMPKVLVREQRARWGSCSSDGTLRFSWRLAMVEPDLIDSVVVHELAHLDVMNHSPAFWEVVLRAMPDARERRTRLNDAGRRLPL